MKFIIITVIIVLIIIITGLCLLSQPVFTEALGNPCDPSAEPVQSDDLLPEPFLINHNKGSFTLNPLYNYQISARVLSKKKYNADWNAVISPYDLALGWGQLADEHINKSIKYDQWGRFYFYKYSQGCHVSHDYILSHSANNHIIPASKNLELAIARLRSGDIVHLEGYLVNVQGRIKGRNYWWNSSTSRNDTGNGACEIIYLQSLRIGDKIYR